MTLDPPRAPATLQGLISRRDELVAAFRQTQELARDSEPLRGALQIAAVFTAALLREVIADWEASPTARADPLETGKLFSYLGDTLSAGGDETSRLEALAAYDRAEHCLRNPIEQRELATLLFNRASMLRSMASGNDYGLPAQAEISLTKASNVSMRDGPAPQWFDAEPEAIKLDLGATAGVTRSSKSAEIDEVRRMLDAEVASGDVRPDRAVTYHRILDKMQSLLLLSEQETIDSTGATSRVKQLFREVEPFVANPGMELPPGSRARTIDDYAGQLKLVIGRQLIERPSPATEAALRAVLGDAQRVQAELRSKPRTTSDLALEANLLRPAAAALHALTMTPHTLLARPLWDCRDYAAGANSIFFSGGADLQAQLECAAALKQMYVHGAPMARDHGQSRWDALNSCRVAIFDFRGCGIKPSRLLADDPRRASELATAAYELGLALATGRSVVVVCNVDDALPFDIDITPLLIGDEVAEVTPALSAAIDDVLYLQQRTATQSSMRATIGRLNQLTANHGQRHVFEKMGWLRPENAEDPARFIAVCEQLLRAIPLNGVHLLRTAWLGAYPDEGELRCFHVTPFGPAWANETRATVRQACAEHGFVYMRGDEATGACIVPAIWYDICRSQLILVDLTEGNLNVLIELAFAHALGRQVLLVRRRGDLSARIPAIQKLRTHEYADARELKSLLRAAVVQFEEVSSRPPQRTS